MDVSSLPCAKKFNFYFTKGVYEIARLVRQSMHLEHAAKGDSYADATTPDAIGEARANVKRWKQRVERQIRFGFFLNKIIRLFFWILLLAYVPVSSCIMRFYLCEPIGDKYYLTADLRVECYTEDYYRVSGVAVIGIIFYMIGIPLLFYAVLKLAREERVTETILKMHEDGQSNMRGRLLGHGSRRH